MEPSHKLEKTLPLWTSCFCGLGKDEREGRDAFVDITLLRSILNYKFRFVKFQYNSVKQLIEVNETALLVLHIN